MKLIIVLLCSFSISAFGQDYLVTNKGDTLRGEIKPMSYDQLDRVQIMENKKKTTLTGLQVKLFFYKGSIYRPIKRDNTIRFMKLLKSGYLSLYAYRMENQNTFDGRFLAKKDGGIMDVPNINFKKNMASFLGGCPSVTAKITRGDYGRNDLDKMIDDYNNCIDNKTETIQKENTLMMEAQQKAAPVEHLKKTVADLPDFSSKKDALDLMNDIIAKLMNKQPVPSYQVEALKGYLKDIDATKEELEKVLTSLKKD